jgi:hypothetical protein
LVEFKVSWTDRRLPYLPHFTKAVNPKESDEVLNLAHDHEKGMKPSFP